MPRRKPLILPTLPERNRAWLNAGLPALSDKQVGELPETGQMSPILADWLRWLRQIPTKRPEEMYCLICYDIERDKIRRLVARLLEKQGCVRVQKSQSGTSRRRRIKTFSDPAGLLLKRLSQSGTSRRRRIKTSSLISRIRAFRSGAQSGTSRRRRIKTII